MQVFIELAANNKEKLHWNLVFIDRRKVSHFELYEKALFKKLFMLLIIKIIGRIYLFSEMFMVQRQGKPTSQFSFTTQLRSVVQQKFCPTSKKFREIHNVVFFVQNFMRNSMVDLVKFFSLGKKSYEQKCRGGYFAQNPIFYGKPLNVGVL